MHYRLRLLDPAGHVESFVYFESGSDKCAIARASQQATGCEAELWSFDRLVMRKKFWATADARPARIFD